MKPQDKKFYTTGWVVLAAYLGGPLAGVYLMSKNFESLERKDYARNILIIGTIISLALATFTFSMPQASDKLAFGFQYMIFNLLTFYALMTKYQSKQIGEHLSNGGTKHSGTTVLGYTFLAALITWGYRALLMILTFIF